MINNLDYLLKFRNSTKITYNALKVYGLLGINICKFTGNQELRV